MIVKRIIAYAIFMVGLILIFSGYSAFTIDHKTTIAGWVFITDIIGMVLCHTAFFSDFKESSTHHAFAYIGLALLLIPNFVYNSFLLNPDANEVMATLEEVNAHPYLSFLEMSTTFSFGLVVFFYFMNKGYDLLKFDDSFLAVIGWVVAPLLLTLVVALVGLFLTIFMSAQVVNYILYFLGIVPVIMLLFVRIKIGDPFEC